MTAYKWFITDLLLYLLAIKTLKVKRDKERTEALTSEQMKQRPLDASQQSV